MISEHISEAEYMCSCCGQFPPDLWVYPVGRDTRQVMEEVYREFFDVFEDIREEYGGPLPISSGYRCPVHQKTLLLTGKTTASISVHNFGLALDIDLPDEAETRMVAQIAIDHLASLRVGYQQYLDEGKTFVHIDMGYRIQPWWSRSLKGGTTW